MPDENHCQHDPNANELWLYFRRVIDWVTSTFTTYRKEMKGVNWGELYDGHHEQTLDTAALEQEIARLMADSDVRTVAGNCQMLCADCNRRKSNI